MCPDVMSGHLLSAVSTTTETMRSLPICSYSLALFLLLPCFFPTYQPIPSFLLSAHVNYLVSTSYGRLEWQFGRLWPSKRLSNLRFSCSTTTSSSTTTQAGSSSQPISQLSKFSIILHNFFSRQKDNKLWKLREESFTNASIVIKRLFTQSFKSITNSARWTPFRLIS